MRWKRIFRLTVEIRITHYSYVLIKGFTLLLACWLTVTWGRNWQPL
jgi:hypothetical protein